MNNYLKQKEIYDKKYNKELQKSGIFYAFSNEQFKNNKIPSNAPDNEFLSWFGGSYIHKDNKSKLVDFFDVKVKELQKEFKDNIKIEDYIKYELSNHECYYTSDYLSIDYLVIELYPELSIQEVHKKIKEVFYNKEVV